MIWLGHGCNNRVLMNCQGSYIFLRKCIITMEKQSPISVAPSKCHITPFPSRYLSYYMVIMNRLNKIWYLLWLSWGLVARHWVCIQMSWIRTNNIAIFLSWLLTIVYNYILWKGNANFLSQYFFRRLMLLLLLYSSENDVFDQPVNMTKLYTGVLWVFIR